MKTVPEEENTVWESVAFASHVNEVIQENCIGCHGPFNPAAGLSLVSSEQVKDAAINHNLLQRITDEQNPMPVGQLMPKTERLKILHWANNGYPE